MSPTGGWRVADHEVPRFAADIDTAPGLRSRASALITRAPLVAGDLACVALGILAADRLGLGVGLATHGAAGIAATLAIALVLLVLSGAYGLADPRSEARRLTSGMLRGAACVAAAGWLSEPSDSIPAWLAEVGVVFGSAGLMARLTRRALRAVLSGTRWWGEPILVLGSDERVAALTLLLERHSRLGLRPVPVASSAGPRFQGREGDIVPTARWAAIDFADRGPGLNRDLRDHSRLFHRLLVFGTRDSIAPLGVPRRALRLDDRLAVALSSRQQTAIGRVFKRAFDLAFGSVATLLALPLILLCAIAVRIDSPGPVFFGHRRLGRNGKRFLVWKFRTMATDANQRLEQLFESRPDLREQWETNHKLDDDPRITRLGRFLRTTSLDELPQLWNVLRGQMSLVGPRPIVDGEVFKYGDVFATYSRVKPGISGLWQISGRNDTTYDERVELDHQYVSKWSPLLDLEILARTPAIVLRRTGAK